MSKVEYFSPVDEDSSDDEFELQIDEYNTNNAVQNGEQDEELEVFTASSNPNKSKQHIVSENDIDSQFQSSTESSHIDGEIQVLKDELFFVEYVPYKPVIRKAVTKIDESELVDISISNNKTKILTDIPNDKSTQVTDEDDEFDFMDSTDTNKNTLKSPPIVVDSTHITSSMEIDKTIDNTSSTDTTSSLSVTKEEKYNVWVASSQALQDISSVYSAGLGDVEVRMLEDQNKHLDQQKVNKPLIYTTKIESKSLISSSTSSQLQSSSSSVSSSSTTNNSNNSMTSHISYHKLDTKQLMNERILEEDEDEAERNELKETLEQEIRIYKESEELLLWNNIDQNQTIDTIVTTDTSTTTPMKPIHINTTMQSDSNANSSTTTTINKIEMISGITSGYDDTGVKEEKEEEHSVNNTKMLSTKAMSTNNSNKDNDNNGHITSNVSKTYTYAELLTYDRMITHLRSVDLTSFESLIVTKDLSTTSTTSNALKWMSSFITSSSSSSTTAAAHSKSTPSASSIHYPGYIEKKDLNFPFLLAQYNYEKYDDMHVFCIGSIYHKLLQFTSNTIIPSSASNSTSISSSIEKQVDRVVAVVVVSLPSIHGNHWEHIGFQGTDPSTDLNRSMKILTLLTTLHMIDYEPDLSSSLYQLSTYTSSPSSSSLSDNKTIKDSSSYRVNKDDMTWPFMCVSILWTKESLQALREGKIYSIVNIYQDVMTAVMIFHHACFYEFGRRLVETPSKHHAIHIADVRKEVTNTPMKIYDTYIQSKQNNTFHQLIYTLPTCTDTTILSSNIATTTTTVDKSTTILSSSDYKMKQNKGTDDANDDVQVVDDDPITYLDDISMIPDTAGINDIIPIEDSEEDAAAATTTTNNNRSKSNILSNIFGGKKQDKFLASS